MVMPIARPARRRWGALRNERDGSVNRVFQILGTPIFPRDKGRVVRAGGEGSGIGETGKVSALRWR